MPQGQVTGYCSTLVLTEQIRCQSLDLHFKKLLWQ
jgi:hypothetical protein